MSTRPSWMASRSAAVKTPTPIVGDRLAGSVAFGGDDDQLGGVPLGRQGVFDGTGLGLRQQAAPGADPDDGLPSVTQVLSRSVVTKGNSRSSDGVDGLRVELEQFAQRLGVAVAAGRAGQLLDPHRRGVQQLVDDAAHGRATSSRCAASSPGSRLSSRSSSASTTSAARWRSAVTVGRDLGHPLSGQVVGHFSGDDRAGGLGVGRRGARRRLALDAVHVDDEHAGQAGDRGIDVAGHAEVADHQLLAAPDRAARPRCTSASDTTGRTAPVQLTTTSASVEHGRQVVERERVGRDARARGSCRRASWRAAASG